MRTRRDLLWLMGLLSLAAVMLRPDPAPSQSPTPSRSPTSSLSPRPSQSLSPVTPPSQEFLLDGVGLGMTLDEVRRLKGEPLEVNFSELSRNATWAYRVQVHSQVSYVIFDFRQGRVHHMSGPADLTVWVGGREEVLRVGRSTGPQVKQVLGPPDRVESHLLNPKPASNEMWHYQRGNLVVRLWDGLYESAEVGGP